MTHYCHAGLASEIADEDYIRTLKLNEKKFKIGVLVL